MYHFSIAVHLQLAGFHEENTCKKLLGEMLIEEKIEFKLMDLGPPGRTCTLIISYF